MATAIEGENLPKIKSTSEILRMNVDELKQALVLLNVDISDMLKPDLQLALIEKMQQIEHHTAPGVSNNGSPNGTPPLSPSKLTQKPSKNTWADLSVSPISGQIPFDVQIEFRKLELQSEIEERKLRYSIEQEQKRFELEFEHKRCVELKRLELEFEQTRESERRQEREHELEREREYERTRREIELKKLEIQQEELNHSHAVSMTQLEHPVAAPRTALFRVDAAIKLVPRFNETDVESFLVSFEKIAHLNAWPENKLSAILQAQLTGKALKVFSELSNEDAEDYNTLKAALLTAYAVVPEVYRKRFRKITRYNSETFSDFAFRLSTQFKRWLEGENVYTDIEKLREVLLIEQFRECLDQELTIWLIDQKPNTLTAAAKLVDQYSAIRKVSKINTPYVYNRSTKSSNGASNQNDAVQRKTDEITPLDKVSMSSENSTITLNRQLRKRSTQEDKIGPHITCHYCKKSGHVISNCRKLLAKKTAENSENGVSSMLVHLPSDKFGADYRDIDPGYKAHCVTATLTRPDHSTKPIVLLRDTGALQSLLSKQALLSTDYVSTGEHRLIKGISGEVQTVPLVEAVITSTYASGAYLFGVANELPKGIDGLIGNDLSSQSCATDILVVTRSQTATSRSASAVGPTTTSNTQSISDDNTPNNDEIDDEFNLAELFENEHSIDRNELIRLQRLDPTLINLYDMVIDENHEKPDNSYYILDNGVLMRAWLDRKFPAGTEIRQIVAPTALHSKILSIAHDIPLAAHLGTAKTLSRILQHFYWPSVSKSTKVYCRTCDTCQRMGKGARRVPAPLQSLPLVNTPFERVAIDIIGPLPTCKQSGNRFILTVLDLCTHYPEAIALKEHTAKDVAQALVSVFSRFGFPVEILSDQGPELQSELMQIFLNDFDVGQIRTSPYHPETNGACEKFNGTIKNMITAVCDQYKTDWDTVLPWVLFAYREVPVQTLGCSPFELLFGRTASGPLSLLKRELLNTTELNTAKKSVVEFILDVRDKIKTSLNVANAYAMVQRDKAKTWYDRRARMRKFEIGDKVLVLLPIYDKPLEAKYVGPYTIVEKLGAVDYVIATPDRRKVRRVCHVNLLKPYFERHAVTPPTPSVLLTCPENINLPVVKTLTHELPSKLSAEQTQDITNICIEFETIFSDKPGKTTLCSHHIELLPNAKPCKCSPYRLNPEKSKFLQKEISDLVQAGLIEESDSCYAAPVVLTPKADGTLRLCTDFRKINAQTVPDPYPLPRVEDLIDRVGKAKYLTKLDMTRGYWQVPLNPKSVPLSAFVTPFGHFQWKVMPFGLRNAPATFSRLVSKLLSGLEFCCTAYLDDILIYSDNWIDHLRHIRTVLTRIKNAGLTLNHTKCVFAAAEVDYLGHHIGLGKVQPREKKVEALLSFARPQTRKQLQSFLGLAGYYRKFIPHFSDIAVNLSNLLKKGNKFEWNDETEKAFLDLKSRLATRPILKPPDFNLPFCLAVDASNVATGAVLFQKIDNIEHPICFFSHKLDKHQTQYSTVEKEALGLVLAVRVFSVYFGSTPVRVYTDHNPLVFINKMANHNQKLLRWSLELDQYNLDIIHRAGKDNLFPDILSRPSIVKAV